MTVDRWPTNADGASRPGTLSRRAAASLLPRPATPLGATLLWGRAVLPGWSDALTRLAGTDPAVMAMSSMMATANALESLPMIASAPLGSFVNGYLYLDDDAISLVTAIGDAGYQRHLAWVLGTQDWPGLAVSTAVASRARATRPKLPESLDIELHERVDALVRQLRSIVTDHIVVSEALKTAISVLDATRAGLRDYVGAADALDTLEPAHRAWDLSRTVRASAVLTTIFDEGVAGLDDRLEARVDEPDVRAFRQALTWLVERYGGLGGKGWDLEAPTWEQRPELALRAVASLRVHDDTADPRRRQAEHRAGRDVALADSLIALTGAPESLARANAARAAVSRFLGWRSRTRLNCLTLVAELRMVFGELGQRWSAAGLLHDSTHVLMLEGDELREVLDDPGAFSLVAADRHELWRALATHEPVASIHAGDALPVAEAVPQRLAARSRGRRARTVIGIPGSAGTASGPSRVLHDVFDATNLGRGDVVVVADADPAWVPALIGAAGVIVECGGWAGHAIVACRELGVPCVAGVDHVTRTVRDGTILELDGTAGTVRFV